MLIPNHAHIFVFRLFGLFYFRTNHFLFSSWWLFLMCSWATVINYLKVILDQLILIDWNDHRESSTLCSFTLKSVSFLGLVSSQDLSLCLYKGFMFLGDHMICEFVNNIILINLGFRVIICCFGFIVELELWKHVLNGFLILIQNWSAHKGELVVIRVWRVFCSFASIELIPGEKAEHILIVVLDLLIVLGFSVFAINLLWLCVSYS